MCYAWMVFHHEKPVQGDHVRLAKHQSFHDWGRQLPVWCFHVRVREQSSIGDVFVLSALVVSAVLDRESVRVFHVQGCGESLNEVSSLQVQNCHPSHREDKCQA
jgi:hypothetical protein